MQQKRPVYCPVKPPRLWLSPGSQLLPGPAGLAGEGEPDTTAAAREPSRGCGKTHEREESLPLPLDAFAVVEEEICEPHVLRGPDLPCQ